MLQKAPFFTVVIPTLNEEKFLPRLLENLAAQTFESFAVVVADGSSVDATVAEAKKFAKKLDLKIVTDQPRNVSIQRNAGADAAKSEWIVFMDADNQLPADFLDGLYTQIEQHETVDIFTTWAQADSTSQFDKAMSQAYNLTIELYDLLGKSQGIGALLGVRRELMTEFRFDPEQKFLEDGFFVKEICAAGHAFEIFHQPRFIYSLRRIKKEGKLKMLQTVAQYQINYLLGGDFSQPFSAKDYPMLGGGYYDEETDEPSERWFSGMQHFIRTASKQQLERAQKVVERLKRLEV